MEDSLIDLENPVNQLTAKVIDSAIAVHTELGPGLLESAYEACLCRELTLREIGFNRQVAVPVMYKGEKVDVGFRMDVLVENDVVLELKAVEDDLPVHKAQLITYLKLSGKKVGLLLNFGVKSMRQGIKRVVL